MIRRTLSLLTILFLLLPLAGAAEEMSFTIAPGVVHPGRMERISFSSSLSGTAVFCLTDAEGQTAFMIRDSLAVSAGENHLTWDGTDSAGNPVAPGEYFLSIRIGETEIARAVAVGQPSPRILNAAGTGRLPWRSTKRAHCLFASKARTAHGATL